MLTIPGFAASFTLDVVLALKSAPPGVIFEIVDRDPSTLELALFWVKQAAQRTKARFPGVPMALVTHDQEMFALQTEKRAANQTVHKIAQSLNRDDGIQVHVCETYANRHGLATEDFPAYIDGARRSRANPQLRSAGLRAASGAPGCSAENPLRTR